MKDSFVGERLPYAIKIEKEINLGHGTAKTLL